MVRQTFWPGNKCISDVTLHFGFFKYFCTFNLYMSTTIYFDNAATTPIRNEVIEVMSDVLKNNFGKITINDIARIIKLLKIEIKTNY